MNKDYVGKDASRPGRGGRCPRSATTQVLFGETKADHPFVQEEQMMPFVPFVRVKNVNEAIELAIKRSMVSPYGDNHSPKHGHDHKIWPTCGHDDFVANGSCPAGLGLGGQGYLNYQHRDAHR